MPQTCRHERHPYVSKFQPIDQDSRGERPAPQPVKPLRICGAGRASRGRGAHVEALSNERRLLILCFLLARGEMKVGELVDAVGLSQSALSQHLAMLRADGLVAFRRESQVLHYRISDPRAARILELLKQVSCGDIT